MTTPYIRYDVVSREEVGRCHKIILCQEHHHLAARDGLADALRTMAERQQEPWDSVALAPQPVGGRLIRKVRKRMRFWARRGYFLGIHWEPRDCWVGVYWTFKHGHWTTRDEEPALHWEREWHLYVCVVPCLPLHLKVPLGVETSEEYYAR